MDPFLAHVGVALDATVVNATPLSGGDTARSMRVVLDDGSVVFAKTHPNPPTATFFEAEAAGLEWLRSLGQLRVPQVLACWDRTAPADPTSGLVLSWIDGLGQRRSTTTESRFGADLARSHLSSAETGIPSAKVGADRLQGATPLRFGRPDGLTTGSLALPNDPVDTWAEFYAANRLVPLAAIAIDRSALPAEVVRDVIEIAQRLDGVGAANEDAVLLHGDLWAGNRLIGPGGDSWVIDPACHGGHREFDLAMMRLFGGFGKECFAAYDETFPLSDGWRERVPLHQLAPLMVHAIKFGGPYVAATARAVAEVRAL